MYKEAWFLCLHFLSRKKTKSFECVWNMPWKFCGMLACCGSAIPNSGLSPIIARSLPSFLFSVSQILYIFWCGFHFVYLPFLLALFRAVDIIAQLVECLLCIREALGSVSPYHKTNSLETFWKSHVIPPPETDGLQKLKTILTWMARLL